MSELRDKLINHIIEVEGGYVNDPDDQGGATNYGITEKVARQNGYFGKMEDLPRSKAYDIYVEKYWHSLRLDQIAEFAPLVAAELADTGVNMGTGRAAQFLQRCLNVFNADGAHYPDIVVDSDLGPTTLRTLKAYIASRDEITLVKALNCLQGSFYIQLAERNPNQERFVTGWIRARVGIPGE